MQDLNDAAEIVAARTLQEIARAKDTVDKATQRRDNLIYGADQADIDAARAAVVLARDRLDKAQEDYAPYENKPEDNLARAALLSKMAAAQNYYDRAATLLNNLVAEANELDLGQAEADLAVAKSQLADAERRYAAVKDGPDPDAVALAGARLASTKARLDQARADPSQEQLELAQSQIDTAGAALQVLETQLQKMVISAPIDGIVLERLVEPGEVALPSAPLLTLARLDDLTITVYVPEDRYGEIKLGQPALVVVDSFPGETFSAMVTHIADQAEFTPRNVQTVEGRSSTVFAIKLAIENPNGQLKPGMPADVTFEP
jgi:multidrug resistance efflux pump